MNLRPRWKKALADLKANPVRTVLVILSIAVGLFALGVITNLMENSSHSMRLGYQGISPANITIKAGNFDWELAENVARMEEVQDALGIREFQIRLMDSGGQWRPLNMRAIPNIHQLRINIPYLMEGSWPPNDQELVIDSHKQAELGLQIGDLVTLELPSGKTRRMKLVGVVQDQSIGASGLGGGYFVAPATGYITAETLPWLGQPKTFNTLFVSLRQGQLDEPWIQAMALKVKDRVEKHGVVVNSTLTGRSDDHPNLTYLHAIGGILLVIGVLIVFLSGTLITNTLAALLNQQVRHIGIMKMVGARRPHIVSIYFALILAYGLVALGISLPLSYQAAAALLDYLCVHINYRVVNFHPSLFATGTQVLVALLVPLAAGAMPVLRGSRISVQEALSGVPAQQGRRPGASLRLRRGLPRPLLISLRNTFRQRVRLALTLLTLSLGGAMFISTFNVRASLDNHIGHIVQYFLADVNLVLQYPSRLEAVEEALMQVEGVAAVEGWAAAQGEIVFADGTTGETVSILGPPADTRLVEPTLMEGEWIQPGDRYTITLNENFRARFPRMKPGDTIRLKLYGLERDWTVRGFFRMAGKSGGYLAYTDFESLGRETHMANRASNFRIRSSSPGLDAAGQKELGRRVEAFLRARGYQVREVTAGMALIESTTDGLNVLTTFLLIMALLTALVGGIGLAGTMSLNVMERTREIGVMRAIGAADGMIALMILVEGLLIGLISWAAGSLLAFPISRILGDVIGWAVFDSGLPFAFNRVGVLLWLGLVALLAVTASLLPARNAVRLTIREVLAYE